MLITFFVLLYFAILFLVDAFLLHFTIKKIFKTKEAKFITAIKVEVFICLVNLLYGAIALVFFLNADKVGSIDNVALSFLQNSIEPFNTVLALITAITGITILYFLLKKYYLFRPLKRIKIIATIFFLYAILSFILIAVFSI